MLISRLKKSFFQICYIPQTISLVWSASRYWTLAWGVLLVIQGLLPVVTVYLTRWLVDSLVMVMGAGVSGQSWEKIVFPVALMGCVLLLTELLRSTSQWVRTAQSDLVQDYISALVHGQSVAIDLGCYESSEYHDHLNRARSNAGENSLSLLENTGNLLQNSLTLFSMAAILLPYGVWLPLVLIISALPSLYIVLNSLFLYALYFTTIINI